MSTLERTLWIADQALDSFSYFGFISILMATFVAVACSKERKKLMQKSQLWLLLPLAGLCAICLTGGLFAQQPKYEYLPLFGLLFVVISATVAIYLNKGCRTAVASLSLVIIWYAFWCAFVAGMSIVDDWV